MTAVTIITASYNYAKYIGETIESVINQTYSDWEMLVIDDGSIDNSIEVINEYTKKDSRVKLLTHPNNENRGLVETLKFGISQAQGEYIVFLESDDYIESYYIESKMKFFQKHNDVGLIYNNINTFGYQPSKHLKKILKEVKSIWIQDKPIKNFAEYLLLDNYIPTFSCVMLKKALLQDLNWTCPLPTVIDWWLWIQISQKTSVYYIDIQLTNWRIHEKSYTNTINANFYKICTFFEKLYDFLPNIKNKHIFIKFIVKKYMRKLKYLMLMTLNIKKIKSNTYEK